MENSATKTEKPKIIEKERVYIYPNDMGTGPIMTNTFLDVVKVDVQPDGSHIVTTEDGNKHFVSNQFINIQAIPMKEETEKTT